MIDDLRAVFAVDLQRQTVKFSTTNWMLFPFGPDCIAQHPEDFASSKPRFFMTGASGTLGWCVRCSALIKRQIVLPQLLPAVLVI